MSIPLLHPQFCIAAPQICNLRCCDRQNLLPLARHLKEGWGARRAHCGGSVVCLILFYQNPFIKIKTTKLLPKYASAKRYDEGLRHAVHAMFGDYGWDPVPLSSLSNGLTGMGTGDGGGSLPDNRGAPTATPDLETLTDSVVTGNALCWSLQYPFPSLPGSPLPPVCTLDTPAGAPAFPFSGLLSGRRRCVAGCGGVIRMLVGPGQSSFIRRGGGGYFG